MLMSRHARPGHRPRVSTMRKDNAITQLVINYAPSYSPVKSTDITCVVCDHRFYIVRDLRITNRTPLLMRCGHAICTSCHCTNPPRPCPICDEQSINLEFKTQLPYNNYVIGLLNVIHTFQSKFDEPDITFHVPLKQVPRLKYDQGACKECGMIANYKCKNCDVIFCSPCFKKFHNKALQDHEAISLNKNAVEFEITNICNNPKHDNAFNDYYCEDCDFEGCSNCILQKHKDHKTVLQEERNENLMSEFYEAVDKLQETRIRIQNTQKNLTKKMICYSNVEESRKIDKEITKHFLYLHGILQNVEHELRSKLFERNVKLKQETEDIRNELSQKEEQLSSAVQLALAAQKNHKNLNMKKLTNKLLEHASVPCHVISAETEESSIRMEIDKTVLDSIKHHIQLHVPDVRKFNLVTTDQLPENYELEPISETELADMSLKMTTKSADVSDIIASQDTSLDDSINVASSLLNGTTERVKVTNLIDPTNFHVQRLSSKRSLEQIEIEIEQYIQQEPPPAKDIQFRQLYIVQNSMSLGWYRGRVIETTQKPNGDSIHKVVFIDYGTTESNVTVDRIRDSLEQFNMVPGMAMHCTLEEIVPMNGEWDDNVLMQFRNMVTGCTLTMNIIQNSGNFYTVDLKKYISNKHDYISLHSWLIDAKLAKPITYNKLKRMNPLSAQQFYYEDLPVNKYTKINISYLESPNLIYVRKVNCKEFEEKMKDFYTDYAKALKESNLTLKNPEFGDTVALSHGSQWQRGIITKIDAGAKKVGVFLVDFGSSVYVDYNKVTRLSQRFCTWHAQAIKISLIDIAPIDGKQWSTEAVSYLKHHLEGRSAKVFPFSKSHNTYQSCIYLANDTNINANLVSNNFAKCTGTHAKHANLNKDITTPKKIRKKMAKKNKIIHDMIEENSENIPKTKTKCTIEDTDPFKLKVIIHKSESPDAIYVSVASDVAIYEEMVERMQIFYKSNVCQWDCTLQPDKYYCAYSNKDKKYYRAQMIELLDCEPLVVKMSLIDLAEVEDIPISKIQPLDIRFMDVPKYIFKVKLAGVMPCGGTSVWQKASCIKLNEIIEDTSDTKYYITLVATNETEEVMPVDLYVRRNIVTGPITPNKKEILSVARKLVECGLALPIRGYVINDDKALAVALKQKLVLSNNVHSEEKQNPISTPVVKEENIVNGNATLPEIDDKPADSSNIIKDEIANEDVLHELSLDEEKGEDSVALKNEGFNEDVLSELPSDQPIITDWVAPDNALKDTIDAVVTYVGYECDVFFHPDTKEYEDKLKYVTTTLNKHCSNRLFKKYDSHTWKEGDVCIANYHWDKNWHRGRVVKVINKNSLRVHFVDFGNTETCKTHLVNRNIILQDIPILCMRTSIIGIAPKQNTWTENELDIIHNLALSHKCRIKVVNSTGKLWKSAVWIEEDSSMYTFPWYLKNKTQVDFIMGDMSAYYVNESLNSDDDMDSNMAISKNGEKCNNSSDAVKSFRFNFNIDMNESNVSKTSSDSETLQNGINAKSNEDSELDSDDVSCVESFQTVRSLINNSDKHSSNVTYKNLCNGRVEEPKDLKNKALNHYFDEDVISSNSVHIQEQLNDTFDIESVTTEIFVNNIENNDECVFSTPINISCQNGVDDDCIDKTKLNGDFNNENGEVLDDTSDFLPGFIDFQRNNITSFKMAIGQSFSPNVMSGYVVHTTDEVLNQCIVLLDKLHNELKAKAETQPLFTFAPGKYCIAKFNDGSWYRALALKKVLSDIGEGVTVQFTDFGNHLTIFDESNIRCIKNDWLELPFLSFYFKLANVQINPKVQKEARCKLYAVLGQCDTYTAIVKKHEPELELELYLDDNCKNLAYGSLIKDNLLQLIDL